MRLPGKNIVLLLMLVATSCHKDIGDEPAANMFLQFPKTDGAYVARDVLSLPDGSLIISMISMLDGAFDTEQLGESPRPALLIKYSAQGDVLWQQSLPDEVRTLWHCALLSNGQILVVGNGLDPGLPAMGVAIISSEGELIQVREIFNQLNFFLAWQGGIPNIDCLELTSGELAICMPSAQASNLPSMPRLILLDDQLNITFDRFYRPDETIKRRHCYEMNISADKQGNIILNGRDIGFNNDSVAYYAYVIKLQAGTYDPLYHQLFSADNRQGVSPAATDNSGTVIWASTGPEPEDTLFRSTFNLRNQELFRIGNKVVLHLVKGNPGQNLTKIITGFPKFGYINQLKSCRDGGYILLGTCNINRNQKLPSLYQVMMVKVGDGLNVEWMEFMETGRPTVAGDIVETNSGFAVSATHLSPDGSLRPVLFKVNKQGRFN